MMERGAARDRSATPLAGPATSHYHRVVREACVDDQHLRGELILTATMLFLLVIAVVLIANLIGAIHVIG